MEFIRLFFVFFYALLLLLFTDDIGDGSKMMRHIHHPTHCASKSMLTMIISFKPTMQSKNAAILMVCYQ